MSDDLQNKIGKTRISSTPAATPFIVTVRFLVLNLFVFLFLKISAQESRRKKKEYMDALERKVEVLSSQNVEYKKRINNLEDTNSSLVSQLQKLQQMLGMQQLQANNIAFVSTIIDDGLLQKNKKKNMSAVITRCKMFLRRCGDILGYNYGGG